MLRHVNCQTQYMNKMLYILFISHKMTDTSTSYDNNNQHHHNIYCYNNTNIKFYYDYYDAIYNNDYDAYYFLL